MKGPPDWRPFFIYPYNGTPSAQPPHQSKVLGGERGRFGGGKGDLSLERSPFHLQFFLYFTSFLNHEIGCMDGSFV